MSSQILWILKIEKNKLTFDGNHTLIHFLIFDRDGEEAAHFQEMDKNCDSVGRVFLIFLL